MNLRKPSLLLISALWISFYSSGQDTPITVEGIVVDGKTKQPLQKVSIEEKARGIVTITDENGNYILELPADASSDSLLFSHVGYKALKRKVSDLKAGETIMMSDFSIELKSITVNARTQNFKKLENSLRRIKGNLFACEAETTNGMYNLFLSYLEDHEQLELLSQCNYDLSGYNKDDQEFYTKYTAPYVPPADKKDTLTRDYTEFPAVNIHHKAAEIYCEWLTAQYNSNDKRKFKKVLFRLPTIKEWQIAALGAPKFQSWNLNENTVEVMIPEDSLAELQKKGKKVTLPVTDDFLYPWWNHYHYRNKPTNPRNCYLANFNARPMPNPCSFGKRPGYDGWTKMSITTSYFPNGFGLYDMVGNVAEMVNEKGKAMGGSWNHFPEQSTMRSIVQYSKPSAFVGFRIFMEVVEE